MLKSNCSQLSDCIILDLINDDLYIDNFAYEFAKKIEKINSLNVVLNLANFKVITSEDIEHLKILHDVLKLNGYSCIICGFSAYNASIVLSFVDDIKFDITLNVKGAIDAFSNRQIK